MRKLRIVVSLPSDNMFQHEQAIAAKATGERLGADVQVMHADNDVIAQSQQVLQVIHARPESRPDAIVVTPLTAIGLPRVAEAAVTAGIGWVVCNAEVDYIGKLRRIANVPVFCVNQDQRELGRLQSAQIAALLPNGGATLYVRGPSTSSQSILRTEGMESAKPQNIQTKIIRSKWSVKSAYEAVSAWLHLTISHAEQIALVACQSNDLALGASQAFRDDQKKKQRAAWVNLPMLGSGPYDQSKPLVDKRVLIAAVITSLTTPLTLEMLVQAIETRVQPPERTLMKASSYPSLEMLELNKKETPRLK